MVWEALHASVHLEQLVEHATIVSLKLTNFFLLKSLIKNNSICIFISYNTSIKSLLSKSMQQWRTMCSSRK